MAKIPPIKVPVEVEFIDHEGQKINMTEAPNIAARLAASNIFPRWNFVVRADGDSYHIDRLDDDGKVRSTRPCTLEMFMLYDHQQTSREALMAFIAEKGADLNAAVSRCADYDMLLRAAIRYAPELAAVENHQRKSKLAELIAAERS